jgi:hypothetical protein
MDLWLSEAEHPDIPRRLAAGDTVSFAGRILVSGANTDAPEYELVVDAILNDSVAVDLADTTSAQLREIQPRTVIAEREDFYDFAAKSGSRSKQFAGRAWNLLAKRYYAHHMSDSHTHSWFAKYKQQPFPVQYEYFDESKNHTQSVGGLDVRSLLTFTDLVDDAVKEKGLTGFREIVGGQSGEMAIEHIDFLRDFANDRLAAALKAAGSSNV